MTKELLQQALDALDKSIIFANSQGIGGWQPTVMACHDAKDAIKQALAQQEQPAQDLYPLPDSLYPDSKDWMAGSYRERVEWLHGMYESTRQEVERLEAQQEPVNWEGADGWEPLAWHLCAEENGEESCTELIWEEGAVPEPWGECWLKYEDAAKLMIATVQKYAPPTQPVLSEARWNYINSRAVDMSAAKYEALCSLLHAEVDDAAYDLGEAVDRAIKAHYRGGAK